MAQPQFRVLPGTPVRLMTAGAEMMHTEAQTRERTHVEHLELLWEKFCTANHNLGEWQRWYEEDLLEAEEALPGMEGVAVWEESQ